MGSARALAAQVPSERTGRPRSQEIAGEIDGEGCGAPGERYACAAVAIVMDEELLTDFLRFNHEPFGTKRPEADDFTNDPIARNFHGREVTLRIEGGG